MTSRSPQFYSGLAWGLGSVVLVSAAQLALKYAMQHLPDLSPETLGMLLEARFTLPLVLLVCGFVSYALSMVCWFVTLRCLPLNTAYPLLSLSYVLVCLWAVVLPCFNETFTILKACGVACVVFGIWLVNTEKG